MSTDDGAQALATAIKALAGASTADAVGIAPGEAFGEEELGDLGREFGPVRSVIALAQRIVDPVQTVMFRSGETLSESRFAATLGDALLRHACWDVIEVLQGAGHRGAIVKNAVYPGDGPGHRISYRKVAGLSGLGVMGRSNLLLHPQWGPWLYLRAVVTDAPLPPDAPITFSPCEGCSRCAAACPSGALSDQGYSRPICEQRDIPRPPGTGNLRVSPHSAIMCEECRRACPIGVAPPRLAICT